MAELSASGTFVYFRAKVCQGEDGRLHIHAADSDVRAPGFHQRVKRGSKGEQTLLRLLSDMGVHGSENDGDRAAKLRERLASLTDEQVLSLRDELDAL